MKIGIDGTCLQGQITGVGRYLKNVLLELAEIDKKNIYEVFFSSNEIPEYFPKKNNFIARILNASVNSHFIWQNTKLASAFNKGDFDVFHFYFYTIPFFLRNKKTKIITSISDVSYEVDPSWYTLISRLAFKPFSRLAAKKSHKIITISEFSKKELMRIYNLADDKVAVTPLGAEVHSITNMNEVREKYKLSSPFILYVGSITERKNIYRLLQAFKILVREKLFKGELVLIGRFFKPHLNLSKVVADMGLGGRVWYFGYIPENEIGAIYNLAECLIYPSLYEGFGLPVVEAMAYRIPVAASNISVLSEVAGDSAVYFDPLDVNDISNALNKLLNDKILRENCIEKGVKRAQMFSWKTTAQKTLEIYNSL